MTYRKQEFHSQMGYLYILARQASPKYTKIPSSSETLAFYRPIIKDHIYLSAVLYHGIYHTDSACFVLGQDCKCAMLMHRYAGELNSCCCTEGI